MNALAIWLLAVPLWTDATSATLGATAEWSNKVIAADIDDDGDLDVVFANGGDYSSAGDPEPNRVFLGDGKGAFVEATAAVFGAIPDAARVVEARDFDGDGHTDLFVGTTWQTQSRVYRGLGDGTFEETTAALPAVELSVGDVAAGDVDADGDLDLLLADWGAGNPLKNAGGRTRLWLNDGHGAFSDATETHTPNALIRFSWDVELADVDNDGDLDGLISCKSCKRSRLFTNDGEGHFADAEGLPEATNNYDFEVMDVTGDGYVDLVTINDGPGLAERLLVNDGTGAFVDATGERWADNPGEDDNVAVFLDADDDGDADLLIGSLSGEDRLYRNTGGDLALVAGAFEGPNTPGTLGLAVGDLNGDGLTDVVEAQGEVAYDDRVYLATAAVAKDTTPPGVTVLTRTVVGDRVRVVARVDERTSPTRDHLFTALSVAATSDSGGPHAAPLVWMGEALFASQLTLPHGAWTLEVCASDAAENEACATTTVELAPPSVEPPDTAPEEDIAVAEDVGVADELGAEVVELSQPPDAAPTDASTPHEDAARATAEAGGCDTSGGPARGLAATLLLALFAAWMTRRARG